METVEKNKKMVTKKGKETEKKKKKFRINNTGRAAIIFVIIALFACFPYLNGSNVYSHDIGFHLNRINGLAEGIGVFDIPHLIDFNMLRGVGYATPLFYPELFLFIPAMLMSIFGINIMTMYKIILILISYFTLFFMYLSLKRMFKKETLAYFGSIIYTFSLYRMVNMFVRGALRRVISNDVFTSDNIWIV